ncbi:MAG TPA: DUF5666 domain-containing protein [Granulicella sp.]|nr:DUF5666 domain-containing protein [Granulicella sp.]
MDFEARRPRLATRAGLQGVSVILFCATAGLFLPSALVPPQAMAQAAAPGTAPVARQIGTVKSISGSTVTLTTDAGQTYTVTVAESARVLQIAPGSTDLKSAQAIALTDIAPGDRILVTGKPGEAADALLAARVVLMKSMDIAQKHAAEAEDWQKRGSGGIVNAIDPASGTLTLTSRGKKVAVHTTSTTIFRRYASDSVKFEDARPGTFSQLEAGDQLRVRGSHSEDGSFIQAEEIVSGSFKNLAGTIASIDTVAGTITLKDLASKKTYTIKVTPNSSVRALPPEMAQRFAARARGGQAAQAGPAGQGGQAGHSPAASQPTQPVATAANPTSGQGYGSGHGAGEGSGPGAAGMDLSQVLVRLPAGSLQDLHPGAAVMVVASESSNAGDGLTVITLLSGVEPILAATPAGQPAMTLSPWNVGGAAPEGGNQ